MMSSQQQSSKRISGAKRSRYALLAAVTALTVSSASGFRQPLGAPSFTRQSLSTAKSFLAEAPPRSSSTALSMSLEEINSFYQTYPLQAAVLTCGVKASFADLIAQVRSFTESEQAIELKRNAAYIIYGGIFIGLMCHIEYDMVFPALFGNGHDAMTVVKEVLFDNFVSAPLMWLPPAYFIKAFMYDYPMKEGLDRYLTDIDEGLLNKYWAIWLPAQTVSFSLLPDHLRVLFMACVSFGWFIILSSSQSQTDEAATVALEEAVESA